MAHSSELFISTLGSGVPMLCLHGIESHGLRFIGLASRLHGVRVVAPDLRGHGRSPMHGPWTVEQHMADLAPTLDSLGPGAVLLGHSYGGLLAWELARARPASVAALILVDPAIAIDPELGATSQDYEHSIVDHEWPDETAAFAELAPGRPASGLWSAALDVGVALRRDESGTLRPLIAAEAVRAGWEQMSRPLRETSYGGRVLLIEAGREHGRYVSAALAERLREQLGDSLQHVVVDATHTIPSDRPDLLATAVGEFLTL